MSSPNPSVVIALPDPAERLKGICIRSQILEGGVTQVEGFVDGRSAICMEQEDGQWRIASVSNPHLNVPQLRMYLDCVQQVLARTVDAPQEVDDEISHDTVDAINSANAPAAGNCVVSAI